MELSQIIRARQSVRRYKDREVTGEDLTRILDAGRMAPSGKNCQNWHFIVIRNKELMKKIGAAILEKNEEIASRMDQKDPEKGLRFRKFVKNFTMFYLDAPVLVVVYATGYYPSGYHEMTFAGYPQEALDKLFTRNPSMQNIGAAMENMTLAAIDLGYGSCWMTGQNYAAEEIEAVIKKEVGFSREGWFLACMLAIGVPQEGLRSPATKELNEICTFVD